MRRVYVLVEGYTELNFAKGTMAPHLAQRGVNFLPIVVTTKKSKKKGIYRGGLSRFSRFEDDLRRLCARGDSRLCFTSMIDLYRLPNDFPGVSEAQAIRDSKGRVEMLELHLSQSIDDSRFLPYIQLHEFEALVLADPRQLIGPFPDHERAIEQLITGLGDQDPESINDGAETAPSKRLIAAIPSYEDRKSTAGPQVADAIGLETLRARCPHFGQWLRRLESLGEI